ncbi:MAG: aminoacetone oxidase family FAD-binding enzyme, partial [Okeania sp. SIO2D1]|nr:aminoacetone oxidase family FAD-binding enzyme [Okeania sp. SIO2D1]
KLKQIGPVLVTHWGLSGPAVLKLSAWGARFLHENDYQADLLINWLSKLNPEDIRTQLLALKTQEKKAIVNSCPFSLPRRLWEGLIIAADIDPRKRWAELSKKAINKLILELTQGKYQVQGKGVFKEEFVTCGGVNLKEINFKTMESRCCQGLYFAGEILDIDGVTGGFNFQSAWTTGWLAGQGMKVRGVGE